MMTKDLFTALADFVYSLNATTQPVAGVLASSKNHSARLAQVEVAPLSSPGTLCHMGTALGITVTYTVIHIPTLMDISVSRLSCESCRNEKR